MSIKKALAIAAAAGALTAVALPAMAFENEFHGTSRLRYFLSNYENGGGGNPLAPSATGTVALPAGSKTENLRLNNYFEQRTRILYTAKASDDLKLVTAFEIDSVFGDRAQGGLPTSTSLATAAGAATSGAFRNTGGALESDAVNLETKHVYLQFKVPSTPTTVLAGIQPFKDSLKGILIDFDAAGIVTSTKLGSTTLNAGYFRGYDQSYFATNRPKGVDNLNIGAIEAKFAVTKDLNVTGAYYLYDDSRGYVATDIPTTSASALGIGTDVQLHVFGLAADAKVGPLTLSGFAAYQGGIIKNFFKTATVGGGSAYLNAFAYNLAAKMAAGPGTLKTALLFTSGNDSAAARTGHLTGWVGTTQAQNNTWGPTTGTSTYNESGMLLLNRNAAAGTGTTDTAIVYNTGNGTSPVNMQGLYLYSLGYDAKFGKAYASANTGFAWTAKTNGQKPINLATGKQSGTNFQGAEINMETGYKMYDNLTASLQAGYVFLGGFYKNSSAYGTAANAKTPQDPYTVRTSLIYNF